MVLLWGPWPGSMFTRTARWIGGAPGRLSSSCRRKATDMNDRGSEAMTIDAALRSDGAAVARQAAPEKTPPAAGPAPADARHTTRKRKLLLGGLGAVALAAALWFGIPMVRLALDTVSTDD